MSTSLPQSLTFYEGSTISGPKWKMTDSLTNQKTNLSGATITIRVTSVDENKTVLFTGTCTIIDAANGVFQYQFQSGDTDIPGRYAIELILIDSSGDAEFFGSMSLIIKENRS